MKQLSFAEKVAIATEAAKREDAADAEALRKCAKIDEAVKAAAKKNAPEQKAA